MSLTLTSGDLLNVRLNYGMVDYVDLGFNVLHYKIGSMTGTVPGMAAGLSAIGQVMFNKWAALWSPGASNKCRMNGVTVTDVFPLPRSVSTTYVPGAPQVGAINSEAIPLQNAPTLLKRTDVGMRWGYGRLFYFGVPESAQHEGLLEGAEAALLQTMGAALSDNVSVSLGGWSAVLNPVLVGGPEDNPVRITPITSGRLSDITIKAMKTRRPGKGI